MSLDIGEGKGGGGKGERHCSDDGNIPYRVGKYDMLHALRR